MTHMQLPLYATRLDALELRAHAEVPRRGLRTPRGLRRRTVPLFETCPLISTKAPAVLDCRPRRRAVRPLAPGPGARSLGRRRRLVELHHVCTAEAERTENPRRRRAGPVEGAHLLHVLCPLATKDASQNARPRPHGRSYSVAPCHAIRGSLHRSLELSRLATHTKDSQY